MSAEISRLKIRAARHEVTRLTLDDLQRLDAQFLERLPEDTRAQLLRYRRADHELSSRQASELLLACAPVLETLVAETFGVEAELRRSRDSALSHGAIFEFKKQFVQRRARKRSSASDASLSFVQLSGWLAASLTGRKLLQTDLERSVATYGMSLLTDVKANAEDIEHLTQWCVGALTTAEGQAVVDGWTSFKLPHSVDHEHLVPVSNIGGRLQGLAEKQHRRDGFGLTDPRMSERAVMNEVHYCVLCHDHDGDFCSKGFPEKKGLPEKGLKANPLGVTMTGCPLDEKISEMQALKKGGHTIGALAMIMVDNPMCPATGHRICNDCMKGCVYQKQEPVNVPQIETRCLTDVLELPWGVEIYDLLTRWNPLRARQWLPKPYNGLKVLVCGMGPAGFTLAHHLTMEGFAVVGIEGMKVEPLQRELLDRPIERYSELVEALDERVMTGFGGVAESGITVRWDKNFLKLIHLVLARRTNFNVFGAVRFGGTITVEDAWGLGFDHVVIAVGSGLPQALPIPGSLAIGMRQANDFLMMLHLSGVARPNSLANLQIRLPAIVIGGGLTAVDAATETAAYYVLQVEKTLNRYEQLVKVRGETYVRRALDAASLTIIDEFLAHGREVRSERKRAQAANEAPNFVRLVRQWGGVTIAYRRGMRDSPAYLGNHDELTEALAEGIFYAEGLDPKEARLDRHDHIASMVFRKQARGEEGRWAPTGEDVVLPARAVLVATGARPNVAYEFEHRGHFKKESGHYQPHREVNGALEPVAVTDHCKQPDFGAFTSYQFGDRRVSYIGDTHPTFQGSVVGAVASGLRIYPKIVEHFGARAAQRGDDREYATFRARMQGLFEARVERITRLNSHVVELAVRAPLAARRFQPGQFFRLQTYETYAPQVLGTLLQTEALALTGSQVDREEGVLSFIVYEAGASARLIATLKPGDPVALMGPTGARARIVENSTVLIVTEGFGHAHIRATGLALRARNTRVLHIAMFAKREDVHLRDDLEAASDVAVWVTAHGECVQPRRAEDRAATGDGTDIVRRYAAGEWGPPAIALSDVAHVMIQGSNCTVRAFKHALEHELGDFFAARPAVTASVSTPMQCGLKGVCAQCLQWQVDPATGQRTKAVFGCSWQDQPLEFIDLDNLDARLAQNRALEHLTSLWLEHVQSTQLPSRPWQKWEVEVALDADEPYLAEI